MGFCGGKLSPWVASKILGEGLLKTAQNCRLVECQETKALARTSAADWSSIRSCSCNFGVRCWGLYLIWRSSEFCVTPVFFFAFITQKLGSSSSGSVAVLLPYSLPSPLWCSLSGCVWTFKNDTLQLKIVGHWCRDNGCPNISDFNITIQTSKESENIQ